MQRYVCVKGSVLIVQKFNSTLLTTRYILGKRHHGRKDHKGPSLFPLEKTDTTEVARKKTE
jgi:hypothetical protein